MLLFILDKSEDCPPAFSFCDSIALKNRTYYDVLRPAIFVWLKQKGQKHQIPAVCNKTKRRFDLMKTPL